MQSYTAHATFILHALVVLTQATLSTWQKMNRTGSSSLTRPYLQNK